VLLAIVCVLALLVVRWIDGGDPGAAPPGGDDPTVVSSDDDGATRTDSHDRVSPDRARSDGVRTVAETFERPHENCDLTQVLVTPTVADPAYAGEPVTITLRVSTSSSTACSLSLDAEHLLLSITSGDDTVWDSTHCDDAIPTRDLALQPRWSALVDVTWSGQYSGRRCPSDGTAAEPGTYTIEAAVLEGEPTATDFELIERPDPVDDDEVKSDDGASDDSTSGTEDDDSTTDTGDDDSSSGDNTGDDTTGGKSDGDDQPTDEPTDEPTADGQT
jgi:hypothetical protein